MTNPHASRAEETGSAETDSEKFAGVSGLSEELRLLVDMVLDRAAPWLDGLLASDHAAGHTSEPEHSGKPQSSESGSNTESSTEASNAEAQADKASASECTWCPLCAVVALARGERPELAAKALAQAAQLIALLRAVLADRWEPEAGVHMPGFKPAPKTKSPEAPSSSSPVAVPLARTKSGSTRNPRVQHVAVQPREDWQTNDR